MLPATLTQLNFLCVAPDSYRDLIILKLNFCFASLLTTVKGPKIVSISEKRGLCVGGFSANWRRKSEGGRLF